MWVPKSDVDLRHGLLVRLRYDFSELVALKLQYQCNALQFDQIRTLSLQAGLPF